MKAYYLTVQYWYNKSNNFVSKVQQTQYHVPSVFGDGKWRKKFTRQNLQLWKNWNKDQKAYSKYYIAFQHRAVANVKVSLCWRYEACHVK